jgi:endonuclease YncB( thermonuclease family)
MKAKRLLIFFLVILLLSIFSIIYPTLTGQVTKPIEYEKEPATLLRVIDGDTIEVLLNNEKASIRMLGINTPEKKMPFCDEAKNFLKQFENKTIFLLRDKEDIDKYNRKLRYVFFEDRLLNKEILENGFANAYMLEDLKYEQDFKLAEKTARLNEMGIWTKSEEVCASCIVLSELNATEEFFVLENNCNFDCTLDGWFVKDAGRNVFYLSAIKSGEQEKVFSKNNKSVWNDVGDSFFMFDKSGLLVEYYEYEEN